jgi:hypothetical protein
MVYTATSEIQKEGGVDLHEPIGDDSAYYSISLQVYAPDAARPDQNTTQAFETEEYHFFGGAECSLAI